MFFFFFDPETLSQYETSRLPGLARLQELTDVIRRIDASMTIGALAALLCIAQRKPALMSGPPVTLRYLARELGVATSTLQRQLDLLGDGGSGGGGLRLIEKKAYPSDRRQRPLALTEEGRRLLLTISAISCRPDDDGQGNHLE